MAAFEGREISELSKSYNDVKSTTSAFENARSDIRTPQHINTINEAYKGKVYPGTNVEYGKSTFMLDGKRVEGVFPKFDSIYNVSLPQNFRTASDTEQFKFCTKTLARKIESNPDLKSSFSSRQLEQIKNGEPRISGLTWHHNQIPGKMQLVNAAEHSVCRHTGGRCLWGGGSQNR